MRIDDLEDSTESEGEPAEDEPGASTEAFRNGPDKEAAEEGTALEDGDSIGVHGCFLSLVISEVSLEGFEREDAVC